MSSCEPRQRWPDVTTEDGEERGHRNRPGSRAGERGHFGLGLFEHQPKLRSITSQPAPGSRELYRALSAPPGAVNEGNAGVPLKRSELLRDRRWRNPQDLAGADDTAMSVNRAQHHQPAWIK